MSEYELSEIRGVGDRTLEKLHAAGYFTVESVAVATGRELAEAIEIGEDRAVELARAARELLDIKFQKADELLEQRKKVTKLSTGCLSLDSILFGGIETQAITELVGEFGAGKTQICYTLCTLAQLPPEQGGLGGNVLYIDTEATFRPERVYQIIKNRNLNSMSSLGNITIARALNSDHLTLIINEAYRTVPENRMKLVLVDSITSQFRSEYLGRSSLADRQQKINRNLRKLLKLAEVYNAAVVVTNQVIAQPDAFFGPVEKPAGGHIVGHASTYRIHIRKGKAGARIAKIFDSPYHPESEAVFHITEKGIEDVAESGKG